MVQHKRQEVETNLAFSQQRFPRHGSLRAEEVGVLGCIPGGACLLVAAASTGPQQHF